MEFSPRLSAVPFLRPVGAGSKNRPAFHGFRVAGLRLGDASPVATTRGPLGAEDAGTLSSLPNIA
jgi:hypothetical protein